MVPYPYPIPLASFTCGPHRRVCMRALPLLPLTTVSGNPSAQGISAYWLSDFPYSLPPTHFRGLCSGFWNPRLWGFTKEAGVEGVSSTKDG